MDAGCGMLVVRGMGYPAHSPAISRTSYDRHPSPSCSAAQLVLLSTHPCAADPLPRRAGVPGLGGEERVAAPLGAPLGYRQWYRQWCVRRSAPSVWVRGCGMYFFYLLVVVAYAAVGLLGVCFLWQLGGEEWQGRE
jgi:hypothetical protein